MPGKKRDLEDSEEGGFEAAEISDSEEDVRSLSSQCSMMVEIWFLQVTILME